MEKKKLAYEQRYPKLYVIFDYIWKILILNLFFVLFSLMGGIVFGIGPAFSASKRIVFDWSNQDHPSMFKTFMNYFKTSFWRHNLIFYGFMVLITIVVFNFFYFYLNLEPSFLRISGLLMNVFLFIYLWIALHLIFIMKHGFLMPWKEAFIFSFKYIWGFPVHILWVLLLHGGIAILSYLMPQIFLFFAYGSMMVSVSLLTDQMKKKFNLIEEEV